MVSSQSLDKPPALELNAERIRLAEAHEHTKPWYRWGPYLSEHQWGTVREDYSPYGTAWDSFPHDHARSRTYRWGEDGLLGISDEECRLCFALSLWADYPYVYRANGMEYVVRYEPGESISGLFGGNSNWRGPIRSPINFLLIETLQKFHHYYGDDFLVECPTGSGEKLTLWQIADQLSCRLTHIFMRGKDRRRPVFGTNETFQTNPHWRDYPLFYEYFHGDTGRGVGASHQTGWTGLVAKLLEQTEGR